MQNFIPKHRMAPRGSLHDWVKVSHHPLVLFNDEHLVWLCICVFYLVNHFLADGAIAPSIKDQVVTDATTGNTVKRNGHRIKPTRGTRSSLSAISPMAAKETGAEIIVIGINLAPAL